MFIIHSLQILKTYGRSCHFPRTEGQRMCPGRLRPKQHVHFDCLDNLFKYIFFTFKINVPAGASRFKSGTGIFDCPVPSVDSLIVRSRGVGRFWRPRIGEYGPNGVTPPKIQFFI